MADSGNLEENKQIILAFFETMNEGDLPGCFALLSDDYEQFILSTREWWSKETFVRMVREGRSEGGLFSSPVQMQVHQLTAESDRVSALTEGHAVTRDGIPYDNLYHHLFQLENGLIRRAWEYNDTKLVHDVVRRMPDGSIGIPST